MNLAEELRTAATTLRDLTQAATPGPWRQHDTHLGQYGYAATVLSGEGNDTDLRAWLPSMSQEPWDEVRNVWPDAAYIAAMHPGVGALLAQLLEVEADVVAARTAQDGTEDYALDYGSGHLLDIARLINGTTP
jgi:hypothetical protein